jgi:hypothetical protein
VKRDRRGEETGKERRGEETGEVRRGEERKGREKRREGQSK